MSLPRSSFFTDALLVYDLDNPLSILVSQLTFYLWVLMIDFGDWLKRDFSAYDIFKCLLAILVTLGMIVHERLSSA